MKKNVSKKNFPFPVFSAHVSAGLPFSCDDHIEQSLDLNQLLIRHPAATFFVKVQGDSMKNRGIETGDLLVIDRAISPKDRHIVLAIVNGEFTVKHLQIKKGQIVLLPENEAYQPLQITEEMDFEIWGVVTNVIKCFV